MKTLREISVLATLALASLLAGAPAARADEPRTHDGFQLRSALGPAFLSDSDSLSDGSFSGTISGPAGSLEVYIGGTPLPGFTVGGYLAGTTVFSSTVSSGGQTVQTPNGVTFGLGQFGPYVDFYPAPTGGFHVLGGVGFAALSVNNGQGASTNSGTGFALNLGVGYDWWVADKLSIGVLGRFTYAHTTVSTSSTDADGNATTVNETDSQVVPAVLFSLTYQ